MVYEHVISLKTLKKTLFVLGPIFVVIVLVYVFLITEPTQRFLRPAFLTDMEIKSRFSVKDQLTKSQEEPYIKTNIPRTLVNTEELMKESKSMITERKGNVIKEHEKTILWYTKPDWTSVDETNSILQKSCFYNNCRMSTNRDYMINSSAIIFTLTEHLNATPPIGQSQRRADQVWVFFGLESPVHTSRPGYRHSNWQNTMNWSMSYRTDSDIFFPYGILVNNDIPFKRDYSAIYHRKTKQVAWAVSNCGAPSRRD